MKALTEKELTIIDKIGNNGGKITQRQIARHAGFSLGLTNLILKRLAKKGYIKISQLTPKKMHYILTRKGLAEKTKKSYHYIFKTIREIKNINNCIQQLMINECQNGMKKIGILGENELTEIIKNFTNQIPQVEIVWLGEKPAINDTQGIDFLINCINNGRDFAKINIQKKINLIDYIANKQDSNIAE